MKTIFAVLNTAWLCLCLNFAGAQIGQQQPLKYNPKQLQEDYAIFRKALETTYPSLYRFTDSSIMSKYLDDNFKSLNQPEPGIEFYKLIATTCAKINDEHLIPQPSKAYYDSLQNTHHYFPFSLQIRFSESPLYLKAF